MAKSTEYEKDFLDAVRGLFSADDTTARTSLKTVEHYIKDEGFNVNASKGDGNTALHILAAHYGPDVKNIFNLLLDNPAVKLDEQNGSKKTPTQLALRAGNKEAATLIARAMDKQKTPAGQTRHKQAVKFIQDCQQNDRQENNIAAHEEAQARRALMDYIANQRVRGK